MNAKKMIMTALAAGLLAFLGAKRIQAQGGGFRFFGPLARVVTPNGDGLNDRLFICFDNFSDSDVSGRIYTLLGAEVARLQDTDPGAGRKGASEVLGLGRRHPHPLATSLALVTDTVFSATIRIARALTHAGVSWTCGAVASSPRSTTSA